MSAVRTAASEASQAGPVHRFVRRLGIALILVALLTGAAPTNDLKVDLTGLRSSRGMLRFCLTSQPSNFPDCRDDKDAVRLSVPASQHEVTFAGLAQGDYALAVIHDENDNNRLDTLMGIPREGFGFSRNPAIRFGPPRFKSAQFTLSGGETEEQVRIRYLL